MLLQELSLSEAIEGMSPPEPQKWEDFSTPEIDKLVDWLREQIVDSNTDYMMMFNQTDAKGVFFILCDRRRSYLAGMLRLTFNLGSPVEIALFDHNLRTLNNICVPVDPDTWTDVDVVNFQERIFKKLALQIAKK